MFQTIAEALLIGYLPGALLFRFPVADRARRAALRAEERAFWAVFISLSLSSTVALGLAAAEQYTFDRLLAANLVVGVAVALLARGRLRLEPDAPRPGLTALAPLVLIGLGLWLYFPSAEYIIGGKDPGVYMNEGIQIAQRGSLVTRDALVASVPPASRALFMQEPQNSTYEGLRFMGYFVTDAEQGAVIGQFPHLYPVWIAIGYGLDGLTGARRAVGVWGILGLLAVYFVGARLVGPLAAFAGSVLLAVHVAQIWFSRYPNSELTLQALMLAGLLAYARTHFDGDRFFAPVSATLLGLSLFARFTAVLSLFAVAGAVLVGFCDGRRPRPSFILVSAVWLALAGWYYGVLLEPYTYRPLEFVLNLQPHHIVFSLLGALALAAIGAGLRDEAFRRRAQKWIPTGVILIVVAGAVYAYFFRTPGGRLAPHDAMALRTYAGYYLSPYGLAATLIGFVIVVRRSFWRAPELILTAAVFAFFCFFKIRAVPEHFWMARRFLPVILPMSLLLTAALAFSGVRRPWPSVPRKFLANGMRFAIGLVFVLLLGYQFVNASRPILNHVEYAGVIPRLEQLADRFEDQDLIIVESRAASDLHVLALPLAYIYARNVLVLSESRPDKLAFLEFLTWARTRFENIFFLGGGGTDLLSNSVAVTPVDSDRFQIPEYESPYNEYPRGVRFKEFDFGLYRFVPAVAVRGPFILNVGTMDDLHVNRFHAKERLQSSDLSFRWSRDRSFVSIAGASPESRTVTLWLSDGGRPPSVERARIEIFINDILLGDAVIASEFNPYTFDIPPELANDMTRTGNVTPLLIVSNTWNPGEVLGTPDDRQLGVMVDRVVVE